MPIAAPPPLRHSHPLAWLVSDLLEERSSKAPYPPGATDFSLSRTKRFTEDPCGVLLECYERFGPIFTTRVFHNRIVFMLGPAANHYITVSNASNFTYRESLFRDFQAFIGDGILTTDGEYHRRMRRIALPALHRESVASYFDTIVEETERALEGLVPGRAVDVHGLVWTLIWRINMRTLFGLDPDGGRARSADLAGMFDQMHAMPIWASAVRAPFTPWARLMRMIRGLDSVVYAELSERRARGGEGRVDFMSLLIEARDEEGEPLTDVQIRDQVMTLMVAGLSTTASTLSFLLYELLRHPDVAARVVAEQETCLDGAAPEVGQIMGGELVELERALEETLRMYPAVWIGARRATEAFEFGGFTVPANAYVSFCPFASHNLPDVFSEPERFRPERFTPDARATIPKGAYIPFGGGSRTCIGMRFAQLEIRTIATLMLKSFELELPRDFSMKVSPLPMLMPKEGLPAIPRERTARHDRVPAIAGR